MLRGRADPRAADPFGCQARKHEITAPDLRRRLKTVSLKGLKKAGLLLFWQLFYQILSKLLGNVVEYKPRCILNAV